MAGARLTERVAASPELRARMPLRSRVLADLRSLLDQEWRNIEEGCYALPEDLVTRPLTALALPAAISPISRASSAPARRRQ